MSSSSSNEETCIVCAKATAGNSGTAYLYHEGRRFALCCPMCVEMFQRAPTRFAGGERRETLVEQLLAEMKWKTPGQW